jgi:chitin synthase
MAALQGSPGNTPSHAQSSLPSLPSHLQSDTHLTAHLASRYSSPDGSLSLPEKTEETTLERNVRIPNTNSGVFRFHVSQPTARLSSQALICLNTFTSSVKGTNGGKEGSAMGEAEDLAKRAWTRLGGRGENQAVVFL